MSVFWNWSFQQYTNLQELLIIKYDEDMTLKMASEELHQILQDDGQLGESLCDLV